MRGIIRLTALFISFIFLLPNCILSVHARKDTTIQNQTNDSNSAEILNSQKESLVISQECCTNKQDSLDGTALVPISANIAEYVVPLSESAQVTFESDDATSYTFEGVNIEILQTSNGSVTFKLQPKMKTGMLRATVACQHDAVMEKTVYLYEKTV